MRESEQVRLLIHHGGSLTQLVYDALGNLVRATDPNQAGSASAAPTTYTYDPLDRLIESIDRLTGVTFLGYDTNDRVTQVTAPNGLSTYYLYDDVGNRLQEQSPPRGLLSYTYDAAGRVATLTDARGVMVQYTDDALGRLTAVDYPGTSDDISYVYDSCANGIGRPCQITDASGVTVYSYDPFGNLAQQTKTEVGVNSSTVYTYDALNRITSITYPDGRVITYTRDAVGRVTTMMQTRSGVTTTLLNNLGYRADGLPTTLTFGNGLTETRGYDQKGQLTSQALSSLLNRTYTYDLNGNLAGVAQSSFSYDLVDRLIQAATGTDNYSYTYDPNGDILYQSRSSADPPPRNMDFTYDAAGQLASVRQNGVLVGSYVYNAFRQRTRKNTGATTVYHYDLAGNLLQETTGTGTPIRSYVWLNQTPIAQIDHGAPEKITYLHVDHLNTPRWGTNAAGTLVWKWEGEPFGQSQPNQDPDQDGVLTVVNLRFPGQYFDAESGLHYNWNRYYDPRTERYLTSDPIGLAGGLNTYAYVSNRPLNLTDFSGLDVTINLYPGAQGFGHIGVGVNTSTTVGFYPDFGTSGFDIVTGQNVPGVVLPDHRDWRVSITIPTTPEQDIAMQEAIKQRVMNPGDYNLHNRQCTGFVLDVLQAGGINCKNTKYPKDLIDQLGQPGGCR